MPNVRRVYSTGNECPLLMQLYNTAAILHYAVMHVPNEVAKPDFSVNTNIMRSSTVCNIIGIDHITWEDV